MDFCRNICKSLVLIYRFRFIKHHDLKICNMQILHCVGRLC